MIFACYSKGFKFVSFYFLSSSYLFGKEVNSITREYWLFSYFLWYLPIDRYLFHCCWRFLQDPLSREEFSLQDMKQAKLFLVDRCLSLMESTSNINLLSTWISFLAFFYKQCSFSLAPLICLRSSFWHLSLLFSTCYYLLIIFFWFFCDSRNET